MDWFTAGVDQMPPMSESWKQTFELTDSGRGERLEKTVIIFSLRNGFDYFDPLAK